MTADDAPPAPPGTAPLIAAVAEAAESADRAGREDGDAPTPVSGRAHAALAAARYHLDRAWHSSSAGTEIPDAARLRSVRRAVMTGLRPVTSQQVPFNRELAVAVDRVAQVLDELVASAAATEGRLGDTLKRVQAGMATVDVGYADMEDEVARLGEQVGDLLRRLAGVEEVLADQRRLLGSTRAREDVVLRAARDAVATAGAGEGAGGPGRPLHALADAATRADATLLRRLAAAGRLEPEELRAQARAVGAAVAAAAVAGPVLDLASDRGDWLDVWIESGVPAAGVDEDDDVAEVLRARGHAVTTGDPVAHLAQVAPGALGAVTAATLADVRPLADVVAVVDRAAAALRPGGLLVLAAVDPATGPGDALWADPRRRPVHPRTLTLLALERGYAEAEVVALDRCYALLARTAGGPAPG